MCGLDTELSYGGMPYPVADLVSSDTLYSEELSVTHYLHSTRVASIELESCLELRPLAVFTPWERR